MPHFEFDAMVNIEADSVMEAAETLHEVANSEGFVMALGKAGTLNVANYRAFVDELKGWIEEHRVYGTTNPPKEVWKDKPFWLVAAELNDMLHDHIGEQE